MRPLLSLNDIRARMRTSCRVSLLALLLAGCTSSPKQRVMSICLDCKHHKLNTDSLYPLIAYSKHLNQNQRTLHVYLEGDGIPWTRSGTPSTNPNSKQLTALKLMQIDTSPSVYINRPCYGFADIPDNCDEQLWTMQRYSETVVNALSLGINEIQDQNHFEKLIIIGHSGGGSLAMLLALRLEGVAGVITLAANLDHKAWTEYFSYLPLEGSLNSIEQGSLPAHIFRWHFAGTEDKQVPASITEEAAKKDLHSQYFLFEGYDHSCCWEKDWKSLLKKITQKTKKASLRKE